MLPTEFPSWRFLTHKQSRKSVWLGPDKGASLELSPKGPRQAGFKRAEPISTLTVLALTVVAPEQLRMACANGRRTQ